MAKQKKKKTTNVSAPMGWYYFNTAEITVEDIMNSVADSSLDIEIWPEAGVLEIGIEEKQSMDIEECDLDMGDEYSNDFVEKIGAKSIFYISFKSEIYNKCEPLLKKMISQLGGKVCGDTEDFTPEISI